MSFTSCRLVVAISPLFRVSVSCGQKLLVLALLPVERVNSATVQPRVERPPQVGLATQPCGERDVADVDAKAPPQLPQRTQLIELAETVRAIPGRRPRRDDEACRLEVAQHPRRPARLFGGVSYAHEMNLSTFMSRFVLDPSVAVLEPHDIFDLRCGDLDDRRVLDRRHPMDRARL